MKRNTPRHRERTRNAQRLKRAAAADGRAACEVCGWEPPAALGRTAWGLLHLHHVVPVAAGGSDEADNLTLLCPNHHAIAHRITRHRYGDLSGPRTRGALLRSMRQLEADPAGWLEAKEARSAAVAGWVAEVVAAAVHGDTPPARPEGLEE